MIILIMIHTYNILNYTSDEVHLLVDLVREECLNV